MNIRWIILIAALTLTGCSSFSGGGTGTGMDTTSSQESVVPPTDFGRGGNRANPPPYDTQSGAFLPATDDTDRQGTDPGKFPSPSH